MPTATGTFTVQISPDGNPGGRDGVSLGRMTLTKQLDGDLVASGAGRMLTAMTPTDGSAGYVAIEQITGTLHGREGSFVLQHSATMDAGNQQMNIVVVPRSGSGGLEGITGSFKITIEDGVHHYEFEYKLP